MKFKSIINDYELECGYIYYEGEILFSAEDYAEYTGMIAESVIDEAYLCVHEAEEDGTEKKYLDFDSLVGQALKEPSLPKTMFLLHVHHRFTIAALPLEDQGEHIEYDEVIEYNDPDYSEFS